MPSRLTPRDGAFVVSLDVELIWGVRDVFPVGGGAYAAHLRGAREAVPAMLDLFARYGIRATWAITGFLFARDCAERGRFDPALRPAYADARLDPYVEAIGDGEADDPLRFAPSLVDRIAAAPEHEIATHTYSHYYALEDGQTRETFAADMAAACAIAAVQGHTLRSIVLPRNQINPAYADVLREAGIVAYRGNPPAWMYRAEPYRAETLVKRAARLADAHLPLTGDLTQGWDEVMQPGGLADVRGSAFLRPFSGNALLDRLHERRIAGGIERAARDGRIFHLWWHPHNFGVRMGDHLTRLERLLQRVDALRARHGLRAMTMGEVAAAALAR